jgi:hypothetical protein
MAKKAFPFQKKGGGKGPPKKGGGKAPPFARKGPPEGSPAEEAAESPAFEAKEDPGNLDDAMTSRTKYAKGGLVR